MPEDVLPWVGLLFTLPEEAQPLLRWMERKEERRLSPYRSCVFGTVPAIPWPLAVCCSGAGIRNAEQAVDLLREACDDRMRCLLLCGFAGSLTAELSVGGLMLATSVLHSCEPPSQEKSYSADSTLLAGAESARLSGVPIRQGTLVTTDRVLITGMEKREMEARTSALAVDMESYGAARIATARGIPWLAVRAITDGVDDTLPLDFNALTDVDGNVDRGRVLRATLLHPWKIPALIRLGMRSAQAANNLTRFLLVFLSTLPAQEL